MAEVSTETGVSQQREDIFLVAKVMFLISVVNDTCIWEPALAKPSYGICIGKPNLTYCSGSQITESLRLEKISKIPESNS